MLNFVGTYDTGGDSTVSYVADSLKPRTADRPFVDIHANGLTMQPVEYDIAAEVKCRINGRGDKRQRGRGNGRVNCVPVSIYGHD